MDRQSLEAALRARRTGRISGNDFFRRTMPEWRRRAEQIYQRWRGSLPAHVEPDDVLQELCLQVDKLAMAWEPGRPVDLVTWVTWGATKETQKRLNKARGAVLHGNAGKNPSRCEIAASRFARREHDDEAGSRDPLEQAGEVDYDGPRERADALAELELRCREEAEVWVIGALWRAAGDLARAADALLQSDEARVAFSILDQGDALGVIGSVLERLVDDTSWMIEAIRATDSVPDERDEVVSEESTIDASNKAA